MNIQSKPGVDKCILMPKALSGWGEQFAVSMSCFLLIRPVKPVSLFLRATRDLPISKC